MMNNFLKIALLILTPSAFAAEYSYHCECTENNNGDKTVEISSSIVTVTNLDYSYGEVGAKFSADFDPKYKPRPSSIKKVRFLGDENGNDREVILENSLLSGAESGYMQLRGDEDGFWSSNFDCTLNQ